ncbi:MAG TPA: LUD domain-containing protein, partial [bacterium]|nr:LUD domain-containing protein [bacterium]
MIEGSQQEQLLTQFSAAVTRAHATVQRIPASGEAVARAVFRRIAKTSSVVMAIPRLLPTEIFTPLIESEAIIKNPTDQQLRDAQIGITEAFAGVARTGSVCVSENSNLSGVVSSFAGEHICLLEANYIVRRPR